LFAGVKLGQKKPTGKELKNKENRAESPGFLPLNLSLADIGQYFL
jgi:hypothetical protein